MEKNKQEWHLRKRELNIPPDEDSYYKIRDDHTLEFGHHIEKKYKHSDIRLILDTRLIGTESTEGPQTYNCEVMWLDLSDSPTFSPNKSEFNDKNYKKYSITLNDLDLHRLFIDPEYYKYVMEQVLDETAVLEEIIAYLNQQIKELIKENAPCRTR